MTSLLQENQPATPPAAAPQQADPQDDDALTINLSERGTLNLQGIVLWLGDVKGFKIIDDGKLTGKASQIKFYPLETKVSKNQLFELVQGILRSNGLALVRADTDGFYRIVELGDVRVFAPFGKPEDFSKAEFITYVFELEHMTAQQADEYLRKTLQATKSSGTASVNSITSLPSRNILIVTDTAKRLQGIATTIKSLDVPAEKMITKFYKVKNLEAAELEEQLTGLLNDTQAVAPPQNNNRGQPLQKRSLKIKADLRTNRLILIGTDREIVRAFELIDQLDIDLGLGFKQYQLRNISAAQIDELVKQSLVGLEEAARERVYQSTVNQQTNQLLVTAGEEIHKRIDGFIRQLDIEGGPKSNPQSPIRYYTLKNVKAADVVETLQAIEQRVIGSGRNRRPNRRRNETRGISARDGLSLNGPNNINTDPNGVPSQPPTQFQRDEVERRQTRRQPGNGAFGNAALNDFANLLDQSRSANNIIPGEAKITIDENSNQLIVVAPPAVQKLYADLIKRLDVRRPQVLVEVFIVTIDEIDNYNFGIEVALGDKTAENQIFTFTNFGLAGDSSILTSGLFRAPGFNGTLINSDVADVIIKALADHSRSKVIGAPKVLVADNGTGVLSSLNEVPFASLNATNTVNTTSFSGFAQAGTTITVSPQISEDDYLNLEFDVTVDDFSAGDSQGGVPPRNSNQVSSQVRIPSGHTVVVGGLKRRRNARTRTGLPVLENIPILRDLTSAQTRAIEDQNLFIFIKPVILRDDKFRDLQHLSEVDQRRANIRGRFPLSKPVLIR